MKFSLKNIRERYGFSQSELSTFLGATRQTFSMVELNKRAFKIDAMKNYALLVKATQEVDAESIQTVERKPKKAQLEQRIKECEYRASQLELKINRLEARALQQEKRKRLIAKLTEKAAQFDEPTRKWLESQSVFSESGVESEIAFLKFTLSIIKYEAEEAKRLLT